MGDSLLKYFYLLPERDGSSTSGGQALTAIAARAVGPVEAFIDITLDQIAQALLRASSRTSSTPWATCSGAEAFMLSLADFGARCGRIIDASLSLLAELLGAREATLDSDRGEADLRDRTPVPAGAAC